MNATILTRFYNSELRLKSVVEQIRALEDTVTWRVHLSKGTDRTRQLLELELMIGLPKHVSVIVTVRPKVTAQEAICQLFEEAKEDEFFIFDDDNWFLPNRVSLQQAICPNPKGMCVVRTVGMREGDLPRYYPINTKGIDVYVDAGAIRFRRDYAQKRLVPATRRAMAQGNGPSLYEDRLWTAIAIKDEEICIHPYPLHLYRFRNDSQMAALTKEKRQELFEWTSRAIITELGVKLTKEERREVESAVLV